MQRFGRVLRLREKAEEEYEKYHANVWPEVLRTIQDAGITNYSIYRHGRWLFSYFELPEGVTTDEVEKVISRSATCQKWEELMHKFQESLPESGETSWWVPAREVFHLDGNGIIVEPKK